MKRRDETEFHKALAFAMETIRDEMSVCNNLCKKYKDTDNTLYMEGLTGYFHLTKVLKVIEDQYWK